MLKKILVPLDGSELAEGVLPYAIELARPAKAQIVLVTAIQQLGVWDATLSLQVIEREEQLAQAYLDNQLRSVPKDVRPSVRLARGPAAEAILQVAAEEKADLIAMSTHGRSGVARFLFGSVPDRILRSSEVPLLIVRPDEEEAPQKKAVSFKRILVPLDGSKTAESILPFVEELAKGLGASLVLFHAITPIAAYPGFELAPVGAAQLITEMEGQAKEILQRAAAEVKSRGVKAEMTVAVDVAVDGILAAAEERSADMIAIATHGRGGLGRVVLGSVADGVVRRSHRPCLVIRAQEEE
jgi:nucleotide-binding universal stress UspA family protein